MHLQPHCTPGGSDYKNALTAGMHVHCRGLPGPLELMAFPGWQGILWLGEQAFDGAGEGVGLLCRSVSSNHFAAAIDEEFGEVPADCPCAEEAEDSALLSFEEAVEGMGVWAIYVDFGKKGEGDAKILLAEGADSGV